MADLGKFSLVKLNNTNYATWKFQMEMFLVREDLWHVVAQPKPEPETSVWQKADRKARATIGLCLEQTQYTIIKDCASAVAVWNALKAYHEKSSTTSQLSLLNRLCDTKLPEGGDVEKHLLEMDSVFERLQNCGLNLDEKLKIAMMLRSMPDSYHSFASALEARPDEEIKLEFVRSKLVDQYQKRLQREGKQVVGEQVLKTQKVNRDIVCFFCKKPGHFKKNCRKWQAAKDKQPVPGPSGNNAGSSGRSNNQPVKAKQANSNTEDNKQHTNNNLLQWSMKTIVAVSILCRLRGRIKEVSISIRNTIMPRA